MHERRGELHALLVPERERLHAICQLRVHLKHLEELGRSAGGLGAIHPVQPCEIHQLFVHAHPRIETTFLGHVPESSARLGVGGLTPPANLARVRLQHAEGDPHRGGLAGTVATHEPNQLAIGHDERDVVERDDVAETPGQSDQLEHAGWRKDTALSDRNSRARPGSFTRA